MIGQPELTLPHQGLAIEPETERLWLGDLNFAGAPGELPAGPATFLSPTAVDYINSLLAEGEQSEYYASLQGPGHLAWGIQQQLGTETRCIGFANLTRITPPDAWPDLQQAESSITLFQSHHLGSGIGTVAYQRMCALGLAAGLDIIRASTNIRNVPSFALHKGCGFIVLGTLLTEGKVQFDMRLCNPSAETSAVQAWTRAIVAERSAAVAGRGNYVDPSEATVVRARKAARTLYARHGDLPAIVLEHTVTLNRFMAE